MFCFTFSFTVFLLMLFPLFSKGFINILKIYELPKTYNKILKNLFAIIIDQVNSMWQLHLLNFIENVQLGAKDFFGTNLKKTLGRIFFLKNVVPKESVFFVASDVVPILYNNPCMCTGYWYPWKELVIQIWISSKDINI